jgi:SagB-type dehydrogenase family enzyme
MDMKTRRSIRTAAVALAAGALLLSAGAVEMRPATVESVALPAAKRTGKLEVEAALGARRSVREFAARALSLAELSQLLWAAQGTTTADGRRTAPSAGALYPLEVSVVAVNVTGLPAGVYRYRPDGHRLLPVATGDRRRALAAAALEQDWMRPAPAALVIAAVFARSERKYGERAARYVHFEAGCAAENVALQAVALGLGTVVVGAFQDREVQAVAALDADERPLAILPVGRPR